MANLVETPLYSHEGATNTPLAPATKATQVQIANVEGQTSNVETEIVALRTKLNQAIDAGVHFRGAVNSTTPLPTVAYAAAISSVVAPYVMAPTQTGGREASLVISTWERWK